MCRAKSDPRGPKICAIHASASKGEEAYTKAKTKASEELIHTTLKELNKEGKNQSVVSPTAQEVNDFLDKETFKVTLDPELTEVERRKILRNLTKARDEAELGVTGGAFHAWKNLMHRVVDKMKVFGEAVKKPLIAFGATGLLVATLAGCSGGVLQNTNPTGGPTDNSTAGPVACSTLTEDQVNALGDAYPAGEVTDSFGTYCHVTINPKSQALVYDKSKTDPSVYDAGFTDADAEAAQDAAVKWVAETFFDSSVLDGTPSQSAEDWARANAGFNPASNITSISSWSAAPVLNGFTTPFPRNGESRMTKLTINDVYVTTVVGSNGTPYLQVKMNTSVSYDATDDQIKQLITNYGETPSSPVLSDGKNTELIGTFGFSVAYDKDVSAGVAGWNWNGPLTVDGEKVG